MEVLQGEGKGAPGKGEAVGEGTHTKALEGRELMEGLGWGGGAVWAQQEIGPVNVQRAQVKTQGPAGCSQQRGR